MVSIHLESPNIYFVISHSFLHLCASKYDLFSVGTNRVGRYSFISKILPQLKCAGLSFYIKIVAPIEKRSLKGRILSFFFPVEISKEEQEAYDFMQGKLYPEILLRQTIEFEEYDRLSSMSKVILDDQKEGQSGLTARFMWAIGNHKRVITTNPYAYDYDFVNKKVAALIDKDNPTIPVDFIKAEIDEGDWPDIIRYRIDNWVKLVLS